MSSVATSLSHGQARSSDRGFSLLDDRERRLLSITRRENRDTLHAKRQHRSPFRPWLDRRLADARPRARGQLSVAPHQNHRAVRAGGSGDITARLIGKQIEQRTNQAVVIDNRPGANGIIGTMAVKTADPDGYTVLLITTSTHAANVSLVRNLPARSGQGFHGGWRVSFQRQLFDGAAAGTVSAISRNSSPPQRGRAGQVDLRLFQCVVAHPAEYLGRLARSNCRAFPIRAIANAVADRSSGEIHCLFMDTTASNQYLQNDQLRPLAITRLTRAPATPDVPTVAETFPGFQLTGFLGMAVPSATPRRSSSS